MKRVILILITPALILLLLGGVVKWILAPRFESWALREIHEYSRKNLPVEITAQSLSVRILKPAVSLEGIEIKTSGETAEMVPAIKIARARAYVDLFQLLIGRLNIAALLVQAPALRVNIDPLLNSSSKPQALPMDEIFNTLEKIPLQRIYIKDGDIEVTSAKMEGSIHLEKAELSLTKRDKNLNAKIEIPTVRLQSKKYGQFGGGLDTHLLLNRQSLKILQSSLSLNKSKIMGHGELTDFKNVTIEPEGTLSLSTEVDLSDLDEQLRQLQKLKIPHLGGELVSEANVHFKGLKNISAKAQLKTKQVTIGPFEVGNASVEGSFKDQTLKLSEFVLTHPSGMAILNDTQISFNEHFRFESKAQVKQMGLQKLLASLSVKNTPLDLQVSGELPCQGQLLEPLQIQCDINIHGKDLQIRGHHKNDPDILRIDQMRAVGRVDIGADSLTYKGNLFVGEDSITSEVGVGYDGDYSVRYKTTRLDLKNIRTIAGLDINGEITADGQADGVLEDVVVKSKITAKNFVFEKIRLGDLSTDLTYQKDHLLLNHILGIYQQTRYAGDVDLALNKLEIQGQVQIGETDLRDISTSIEPLYKFPVRMSGPGNANASFQGPLDLLKMSFQFNTNFKNISVAGESFDELNLNVQSTSGDIKINTASLRKGKGNIVVTGGIKPDRTLQLKAQGKNWQIDEMDTVSRMNARIYGNMNFDVDTSGNIDNPLIVGKGQVVETVIEEQEIPDSDFNFRVSKNSFDGDANLFGKKIVGQVKIPFQSNSPLSLKLQTHDWAFASLFSLLGGGALVNEYESSLTADIDLQSDLGNIFKSTGAIRLQEVYLKRGNNSLRNPKPIEIQLNQGVISIQNFLLEGANNKISLKGTQFTADNLDVSVAASTELRLLHVFAPALEDIGGPLQIQATVSGSVRKPEILGNMSLNNAFVKIKGFPHPFEKINADVVFSHKRILINSVKGQLGGGNVTGDGLVQINEFRNVPANIRLRLEGATLNVPDRFRTTGRAELVLSGQWFPFTLAGTYYVNSAFIDKEFGDDDGSVNSIRQSIYLPKVLKEASFEPIILDLQILMEKNVVIKNSLMEGSIQGNLQVKGSPQNPSLLGRITLDKNSKLMFKDKVFEIQTGEIQFNNPSDINPEIYLSAQSRVNEYDISLLVQGPAKSLASGGLRLSSVPPLPEQDIISLLALGVTSSSQRLDQPQLAQSSKDQENQASYEIGAAIIGAPINKRVQSYTGFNLQFSSSYDSLRNINVPKVTLSRKLNNRLNASASRTIGDQTSYDVKLTYILNQNISAIGSWENRENQDNTSLRNNEKTMQSIFGLDLEFKREFK